jgi:lipopolysaccharide biosynthesis protein
MARAVVFAHYDRDGIVDDYVVDALQNYRRIAERLVVVSASAARLPEPLMRSVDQFIPRENIGYDFCSWRDGIESLGDVGRFDELLCVNDSVYGPFAGLEETLARRQRTNGDLWGMCLSQQGPKSRGRRSCPHVQSWFFAMRRPILQSHSFAEFWNAVKPLPSKEEIIERYELGMSEHFQRDGFRISAVYDDRSQTPLGGREFLANLSFQEPARSWRYVRKASRPFSRNPSELFPLRLIDSGVPYAKVSLFRVNHYGVNTQDVLRRIRAHAEYDTSLITNHLARVQRS